MFTLYYIYNAQCIICFLVLTLPSILIVGKGLYARRDIFPLRSASITIKSYIPEYNSFLLWTI